MTEHKAPKGAKPPLPPLPPRVPTMIDITPTWRAILPVLLAVHVDGNAAGKTEAERELRRMADLADQFVKIAAHDPARVRAMIEAANVGEETT